MPPHLPNFQCFQSIVCMSHTICQCSDTCSNRHQVSENEIIWFTSPVKLKTNVPKCLRRLWKALYRQLLALHFRLCIFFQPRIGSKRPVIQTIFDGSHPRCLLLRRTKLGTVDWIIYMQFKLNSTNVAIRVMARNRGERFAASNCKYWLISARSLAPFGYNEWPSG